MTWHSEWLRLSGQATSLLVVAGIEFDPRSRKNSRILFTETDQVQIGHLAEALAVDRSARNDVALTMWPVMSFVLLDKRQPLGLISVLDNEWIRHSDRSSGDLRLLTPEALDTWLITRNLDLRRQPQTRCST